MRVLPNSRSIETPMGPFAIAVGVLDGVHLGHQALLAHTSELAARERIESLAYSFHPHPAKVLAPDLAPRLIEPIESRLEQFAVHGVSAALIEHFDPSYARVKPLAFARDILQYKLQARHVVVGEGFTFGHRAEGTVEVLAALGREYGFEVHAIDKVKAGGVLVSSTKIRGFVSAGQVRGAALLQGRPYEMRGVVVRGAGRGASIGFPTANLLPHNELLPAVGVYAVRAAGFFGTLPGVVNVGYTPTFDTSGLKIEAHLLDYAGGHLYGRPVSLEFVDRLRDEQKFDGIDALKAQIARDIDAARELLSEEP